jgi:hypothetical protein
MAGEHCIMRNFITCTLHGQEVARMGEMRNTYKILAAKPEGKRPLGRSRRRWEDNVRNAA